MKQNHFDKSHTNMSPLVKQKSLKNLSIVFSLIAEKKKKIRYNLLKTKIQPFEYGVCFNKPDVRSCWGIVANMRDYFQF